MNTIERKVLASVVLIYAARQLASRTALKLYVLLLAAAGIISFVSLPHVLANLANVRDAAGFALFALSAVENTRLLVQISLLAGSLAFVSLFVGFIRPSLRLRTA